MGQRVEQVDTHREVQRRGCGFRHWQVQYVDEFRQVRIDFLDVKSFVEHDGEG